MFDSFKKKISTKEMATGLYHSSITMHLNKKLNNEEGDPILTRQEQALLLTQHLCELLEIYHLKHAKPYLLASYVTDNYKVRNDDDLMLQIAVSLESVEKIQKYFKEVLSNQDKFFTVNFLFDKDLSSVQKTLVMSWYTASCKIIDEAFKSSINKVILVDERGD